MGSQTHNSAFGGPLRGEQSCETKPNLGGLGYLETRRGELIVPNKANSVRGSKESSAWWEKSYGESDIGETSAKQSQFPATPGGTGPGGRGTTAQNKPNSRRRRVGPGLRDGGRGVLYKQTQFGPGPCEGQVLYGQGVMVDYTCRGLRQNKANSRRGRAILPRRSTLWPPSVGCANKPNWPRRTGKPGRGGGQLCRTNPIWPVGRSPEGEIGKTKSRLVLCFQEPGTFV